MGNGNTAPFPEWEQARLRAQPEDSAQRQLVAWLQLPIGSEEIGRLAARKRALQELVDTAPVPAASRLYQRLSDPRDPLGQFLRFELSDPLRNDLINRLAARERAGSRSTDVRQRGTPALHHEPLHQRSALPTGRTQPSLHHEPLHQRSTEPSARLTRDDKPYMPPLIVPVECLATPQYFPLGLPPYALDRPVWLVPAPCTKQPPPKCVLPLKLCEDEKARREREERERKERERKEREERERKERERRERERKDRERQEKERQDRERQDREREEREKRERERQKQKEKEKEKEREKAKEKEKQEEKEKEGEKDKDKTKDKDKQLTDAEAVNWLNDQTQKSGEVASLIAPLLSTMSPVLVALVVYTMTRYLRAGGTVARAGEIAAKQIMLRRLRSQGVVRVFDLNTRWETFPGIDLISTARAWQVKMWGVFPEKDLSKPYARKGYLQEVAGKVANEMMNVYGWRPTSKLKNTVNTLLRRRPEIEGRGAWPTALSGNPTFDDALAFLRQTAFVVASDLAPLVRQILGTKINSIPKFREMFPELRVGSEIDIKSLSLKEQTEWAKRHDAFLNDRVVDFGITTKQLRKKAEAAEKINAAELRARRPVL